MDYRERTCPATYCQNPANAPGTEVSINYDGPSCAAGNRSGELCALSSCERVMPAAEKFQNTESAETNSDRVRSSNDGGIVVELVPRSDLYADEHLLSLQDRATIYLRSGIPVHLRGPAGTGKSTMALQIAARLGRPIAMLSGDHGVTSKDLVGKEGGTRTKKVVDRFIHNVQKHETETSTIWIDSALTTAVMNGYTLFYDEFTRSPPEANNAFLMALEERRLLVPGRQGSDAYIEAHPEFRAIFTSNPDDYAGVQIPQDALIDRMITLEMGEQELATEVGIVSSRTGLSVGDAERIVRLVRRVRSEAGHRSASIRSAIMIGSVVASEGLVPDHQDPAFVQLCIDALFARWSRGELGRTRKQFVTETMSDLIEKPESEAP